jgi:glycosyltransferase involved in cell wall biosynthesis
LSASRTTQASVVITNHNYGRWLAEAIDSALSQRGSEVEVIVVDDGSTDGSRELIASYGDRVRPVLQPNGGQAAALNAGFAASRGDPVLFLDADDVLLPNAVARARGSLEDPTVAHVQWPHEVIDEESRPTGERFPDRRLPAGDLRQVVARLGPGVLLTSPTSGNAFPRWLLERVMPIRPPRLRMCADQYVIQLAPLFGSVVALDDPGSLYRRHNGSGYAGASFDRQLALGYETIELLIDPCAEWCRRLDLQADPSRWRASSWFHCLREVVSTLEAVIPPGALFVMIDDGQTGMASTPARRVVPFPERNGIWWGAPADDSAAIAELERQRSLGAAYLAVIWIARWWLDYYGGFSAYLRERYRAVREHELVTIFDLSG